MEHDLKIEKEDMKFQNNEEFLIWKSKEENSKICKFVQLRGAEKRWTVDFTTLPHIIVIEVSRYKMPVLGQVERGASIDLTWGRFWDKWSVERG
ncbi:hypothetical protein TNCV_4130811 [Trichonephila clavipes]|nr:hypothetical protein TNCV_4130811 [Trichonephila clavipes]